MDKSTCCVREYVESLENKQQDPNTVIKKMTIIDKDLLQADAIIGTGKTEI
jgi:hypothetical protein